MANNGKMIVYDKSKTTGAMAAAMGLLDEVPRKKRVDKDNSNFKSDKNTPTTSATRPNVNYGKKDGDNNNKTKVYNKNWKQRPRMLSPEEQREKGIKLTLDALEEMMIEVGDEYTKMKGRNYRIKTGIIDSYGGEIIIRAFQDPADAADIITLFDDDGVLNDFIYEHDEDEVRADILRFMSRVGNKDLRFVYNTKNGNPDCYLQIKGKVKDYVYMKWAILDVLQSVYDEDKELREECGL